VSSRPISSIAIAGGGIVAWSAAAAVRRRLPSIRVTVIDLPVPGNALADRLGCTLPSIVDFHQDLGLRDADTVLRAGSGFRLGTRFDGWSGYRSEFVHAYGEYGQTLAGSAFHQHWLRAEHLGEAAPFDDYSTGAAIALAGHFLPSEHTRASRIANYAYGLHIQPLRYREMMRAFALHLGAEERSGPISEVILRDDGFIEALDLADGGEIRADLFIDAGGPAALVRTQLDGRREDWARHLIVDQLIISDQTRPPVDSPALDHVKALDRGWTWEASSPAHVSRGLAYSSEHLGHDQARDLIDNGEQVVLAPGRLTDPWVRNCVAIGDAAVAIEPLEWTNLHLAHSAIDRIVTMMPDVDCNPVELWDYNRQANAEADRARDFVMLHYAGPNRREPFWRDAASRPLPTTLEHSLQQWRERGRLPFHEEETFSRDSWAAVLIGQGIFPRRIDPLLTSVPKNESARAMENLRSAIMGVVAQTSQQSAYLRNLALQESR